MESSSAVPVLRSLIIASTRRCDESTGACCTPSTVSISTPHDASLIAPTADETAQLKLAIYNWWRNSGRYGGVMYRGQSAKWDQNGNVRTQEVRAAMEAARGGKRKRSVPDTGAATGGGGAPGGGAVGLAGV